ncbi:MAG TPA: ribosomal protein S18-alanine N-acetyltransferase [Acidimicrobiales bacterium]|nr:ribosomal protein S18-alanine N-acetyltransferase [Acidimicrobiales bacterium]
MTAPAEVAPLRIAPMRRRHLRAVLRTEAQVYPQPWTIGLYLGELAQPDDRRRYVVARVGGTVVGHAGMIVAVDEAHVTTVAVDPAWQRRGIGARLLLDLVLAAREAALAGVTLEVRSANPAAIALYERFGFVAEGVRRGYYAETGEDAVIMWLRDLQGDEAGDRLDRLARELGHPVDGPLELDPASGEAAS